MRGRTIQQLWLRVVWYQMHPDPGYLLTHRCRRYQPVIAPVSQSFEMWLGNGSFKATNAMVFGGFWFSSILKVVELPESRRILNSLNQEHKERFQLECFQDYSEPSLVHYAAFSFECGEPNNIYRQPWLGVLINIIPTQNVVNRKGNDAFLGLHKGKTNTEPAPPPSRLFL